MNHYDAWSSWDVNSCQCHSVLFQSTKAASGSSEAKQKISFSMTDKIRCFHCEQQGYHVQRCPELSKCYRCGNPKHISGICPEPKPATVTRLVASEEKGSLPILLQPAVAASIPGLPPDLLAANEGLPMYLSISSKHPDIMVNGTESFFLSIFFFKNFYSY